jgi:hypothetical protein
MRTSSRRINELIRTGNASVEKTLTRQHEAHLRLDWMLTGSSRIIENEERWTAPSGQ